MLVDDRIRDLVQAEVEQLDTGDLVDVSQIHQAAGRRNRRRRATGGLATVLVVCLMIGGAATLWQRDEPSAVFAGLDAAELRPTQVLVHDGEFVGLIEVGNADADDENRTAGLLRSSDGEEWELVRGAPEFSGTSMMLGERDGRFAILGVRRSEANDSATSLFYATSRDLKTWIQSVHPLPDEIDIEDLRASIKGFESLPGDEAAGIAVIDLRPRTYDVDLALREVGIAPESICALDGSPGRIEVRLCGATELTIVGDSPTVNPQHVQHVLRVDRAGIDVVTLPKLDVGQALLGIHDMYATADAVGLVGYRVFETTTGFDWVDASPRDQTASFIGIRGDTHVFRTPGVITRFGAGDPVWGMGYSSDGGDTWVDIDISELLSSQADPRMSWFSAVSVGEAGWAFVANRFVTPTDLSTGQTQPFTVSSGDVVLAGSHPFGPAELRTQEGEVLRTWDHFEFGNPEWSGLEVVGVELRSVDEAGVIEATFTVDQWEQAALAALGEPIDQPRSEILFSPDGLDWEVIKTAGQHPQILAIGEDRLIVSWSSLGPLGDPIGQFEVMSLPINAN